MSHTATLEVRWLSSAIRSSNTRLVEPEGSSPLGRREVHKPLHNQDAARDLPFDPRGEVSRLTLCLDVV